MLRSRPAISCLVPALLAVPALPAGAQQGPASAVAAPAALPDAPVPTAPVPTAPLPTAEPDIADFPPLPGAEDVPWPTVEATTAGSAAAADATLRYAVTVAGLGALGLDDEFRALSALWTRRSDDANLAQINRRIAEDRELIDQLLRSVGHYGGDVRAVVATPPGGGQLLVTLTVTPGPLYTLDTVRVTRPDDAVGGDPAPVALRLLGLRPGDPIDAARVTAATDGLAARLGDAGFPFPRVAKPEIVVDHATRSASLTQSVDLGARGRFAGIRLAGDTAGFTPEHVQMLARYRPGEVFSGAGREDLRRAMIQTGLFGSVSIRPLEGTLNPDGTRNVDLEVTTESAPQRTVAAAGGYSTGQGIRVEGSWSHRNLFPPEGALTLRAVAAEREQVAAAEYQRRNWRRRDQTLTVAGGLTFSQQFAFSANTVGVTASVARESNIVWQKPWTYTVGAQLLATSQRDRSAPGLPRNLFYIFALPSSVTWDQSDDLLNPSRGFRLTARASPEFSLRSGRNFNYFKAQIDATAYRPVGPLVLAGRLHFGAIAGAERGVIAPDRRFYAGGGGSVRGYDFQGVGPKNPDGTPTGGNSLTEASIEARYRFRAFGNDIGLVAFVDGGQVYKATVPSFDSLRLGAGLGLRYYTSFGPVRVDVATPIGRRPGDPLVAFYVSIGQAF